MAYVKLLVFVIACSVAIWLAVEKLLISTDDIAESFTVDNYTAYDDKSQIKTIALTPVDPDDPLAGLEVELEEQLENELAANNSAESKLLIPENENDALIDEELELEENAELKLLAEEADKLTLDEDNPTEKNIASEPDEKERADSDADIQNNKNEENKDTIEGSQTNSLNLDKKLVDTIKPSETLENTIKSKAETVRALDLTIALPEGSSCSVPANQNPRVGIHYRPSSFAIKGKSLTSIDKLITIYNKCGGKLLVLENRVDADESEERLIQLRQDEVKYYLLQRRVPKGDMIFPDNS